MGTVRILIYALFYHFCSLLFVWMVDLDLFLCVQLPFITYSTKSPVTIIIKKRWLKNHRLERENKNIARSIEWRVR